MILTVIGPLSDGARSVQENIDFASQRGKKVNVSHPPLFPTIPLTNVVIDLFLQVADVLMKVFTNI